MGQNGRLGIILERECSGFSSQILERSLWQLSTATLYCRSHLPLSRTKAQESGCLRLTDLTGEA